MSSNHTHNDPRGHVATKIGRVLAQSGPEQSAGQYEITAEAFSQARHAQPSDFYLLDIRTEDEVRKARFPGAHHIPMHSLQFELEDLPKEQEIIVICHHGVRSLMIAELLSGQGFARIRSLKGGIDYWSKNIDSTIPRY